MDLLKTMVLYLSLVFATSVENAPEPTPIPEVTASPTPYVQAVTPTPSPSPTPVPTINITPNPAYKTLEVGDKGDLVRQMQQKLIEYGYLTGEADGAYGNQTRRAVEAFQYQHGLSVDGIAGRNTLTVLYESDEVRMAPGVEATPAPTQEAHVSVALTPAPSVAPAASMLPDTSAPTDTPAPTSTPAPTDTPKPSDTPVPSATPAPVWEAMEGYQLLLADGAAVEQTPYRYGETVYLPLVSILEASGLNVIATDSLDQNEFAFARGNDLIRVAYSESQSGEPVQLEVYINTVPQVLPTRDIRSVDKHIYLPADSLQAFAGLNMQVNENAKTITVSFGADGEAEK